MLKKASNGHNADASGGEVAGKLRIAGQILISADEEAGATPYGRFDHGIVLGVSDRNNLCDDGDSLGSADDALKVFLEICVSVPVLQHQSWPREHTVEFFHEGSRNRNLEGTVNPGAKECGRKPVGVQERRDPDIRVHDYGGRHSPAHCGSRLVAVMSTSISSLEKRSVLTWIRARNSLNSLAQ